MTKEQIGELNRLALKVREHIIRMATDGGCFIGASLSCVDLHGSASADPASDPILNR